LRWLVGGVFCVRGFVGSAGDLAAAAPAGKGLDVAEGLHRGIQAAVLVDDRTKLVKARAELFTDAVQEIGQAGSFRQGDRILADDLGARM
jgi:hypothetical protein